MLLPTKSHPKRKTTAISDRASNLDYKNPNLRRNPQCSRFPGNNARSTAPGTEDSIRRTGFAGHIRPHQDFRAFRIGEYVIFLQRG
jgi:hypothetical protein